MTRSILQARAVSKEFSGGIHALREVDLDVSLGETLALIGESGCGKTTLLRMFNRLEEPTSGEIRVCGVSARELQPIPLRRGIGYVQQDGGLLPHWTLARNVQLVPTLLGWSPQRRRERVDGLMRLVGLDPDRYRERYPREVSGGQRQRVAFARALAADPEIVLLDEPFGAVDALTRLVLQREFLEIKRRLGKTMILVTHDLDEALRLGDRVAVMQGGRLLQTGTEHELRTHPAADYVERLLAMSAGGPR